MTIYSEALKAYFKRDDALKQDDIAGKAGCTQAAISRYANGRHPPRHVAEKIAEATDDAVPMTLWRVVAAERAGLAA